MYQRNRRIMNNRGAITVFLALIFMSLIIFAGTVIDIVRITAADRKVQSALNTSVRSILAGYDSELMGSYGIYGVNVAREDVKKNFYRYLNVNLRERHKNMNFTDIEIGYEDIEIQGMEGLLKSETFKRQIQEHMKYRTPISLSDTLIDQLQNIGLDKKIAFAKSEKVTRAKAIELRIKVNEVNIRLASIKQNLINLSAKKLEDIKNELLEILEVNETIYCGDNEGLLIDYIQSKDDTNTKAEESECVENKSREFDNVGEDNKNLTPGIQEYLKKIDKTLMVVRPLQKELELMEKKLKRLKDELSDLKQKLSDLPKGDADIAKEIDDVKDDINEVKDKIEQLDSQIDKEISELRMELGGIALEGYSLNTESVQLDYNKSEELKNFIKKTKEEIEKSLLSRLEKEWLITPDEFKDNNPIVGGNLSEMNERAYYSPLMPEKEAERSNDEIISTMEKLADAIEDIASSTSEKINIIEYVMDKYSFLTSRTARNHYFSKGEVEYIIGGSDIGEEYSQIKNTEYYIVTKVLLQVWALRFALDTVDAFIRSTVIFPPQRLAFALAEGALDSSLDMFNLLNGEPVSIFHESFPAVKLKYSDHLRILLLMKPEEEILRKARQLIQINIKQVVDVETGIPRSDFRLGDYNTVISASVKAKVNLFFLPLLKVDSLLPGKFEGGKYIIQKQIYVGY
ncbi:MAG: pilus assembly protein TadG-related protein [Clostridiaceae bacterium]|nr:pilus assembly protein TadG-related protein [Clostridiaceae bacterium]